LIICITKPCWALGKRWMLHLLLQLGRRSALAWGGIECRP